MAEKRQYQGKEGKTKKREKKKKTNSRPGLAQATAVTQLYNVRPTLLPTLRYNRLLAKRQCVDI